MNVSQQSKMGLRTRIKAKEVQSITRNNNQAPTEQTETNSKGTEPSVKQLTLVNRLRSDRKYLDREEGWNGISSHGPSHHGPRIPLVVHQETCGTS